MIDHIDLITDTLPYSGAITHHVTKILPVACEAYPVLLAERLSLQPDYEESNEPLGFQFVMGDVSHDIKIPSLLQYKIYRSY